MKKQKNKFLKIIKLLLCISLSLNLIGCMDSAEDKRILEREKTKVEEYLKVKYGKEFVVIGAKYRRPELGKILIDTTAYPEDDKNIKFRVTVSPKDLSSADPFGSDYKENGHYDTYLGKYWAEAAYEELKPIIEKVFPKNVRLFEFNVSAAGDLNVHNILGYTPTFKETKKKYPEKINLRLKVEIDKNDVDIQQESEKILELINKIKNPKLGHYQLQFYYSDNSEKYVCSIWKANIDEVQSAEDIVNKFKIINKD